MLVAFATLLIALAAGDPDPRTLLLRWLAIFWLTVTVLVCWNGRRNPRSLLRLPVPFVFVLIAAMCWLAA